MLPMLDEEGRVPRGSDITWFNKVKKKYESRAKKNWGKAFAKSKKKSLANVIAVAGAHKHADSTLNASSSCFEVKFDDFIVHHYAGKVQYRVDGFMISFMGLFFIVFSFFKFLGYRSFPSSFATYDPIAKLIPLYGWLYPFIETALGLAFLFQHSLNT